MISFAGFRTLPAVEVLSAYACERMRCELLLVKQGELMPTEAHVTTNNKLKPVSITLYPGDEPSIDLRIGDVHPAEHVLLTRAQAAMIAAILNAASRTSDSE